MHLQQVIFYLGNPWMDLLNFAYTHPLLGGIDVPLGVYEISPT